MDGSSRGVLYPARLPTFHRLPAPPELDALVRWFWIPEWDLAPGRASRQELLPYPACNLVVEPGLVGFSGPATRRSVRELRGRGWAVGALLRPAAVPAFTADPAADRDAYRAIEAPELHAAVSDAMGGREARETAEGSRGGGAGDGLRGGGAGDGSRDEGWGDRRGGGGAGDAPRDEGAGDGHARRARAVAALGAWIAERRPDPGHDGALANALVALAESDPAIERVEQLAVRLGVSARTVQRLARRYVGLPPLALIRRRRLQEAAELLRADATATIAGVAASLGYADQAHLAANFRDVLGLTPSGYRATAAG